MLDTQTSRSNDALAMEALRLVDAAGLREACDLDLLLFFSRHPRVVVSSDQLATYVGYERPHVARALDLLLGAGHVKRVLNQGSSGRMYVLDMDRVETWIEPVRTLCARPDGRHALRTLMKERRGSALTQNGEPRL